MTSFVHLGFTMDGPLDINGVLDVRDMHIEATTPGILEKSTRSASAVLLVIPNIVRSSWKVLPTVMDTQVPRHKIGLSTGNPVFQTTPAPGHNLIPNFPQ